ncbi:hypothetical protein F4818DRAFT_445449 [Hypoxylon cercidicola]|nr:hypothetical protein F4818DRAFT_445449 [Hypoxylon cercidicola]
MAMVQGIIGAVCDFYILTIPLAMIFGLRLSTLKKVGIASIFVVGSSYDLFTYPYQFRQYGLTKIRACAFAIMGIYFRVIASKAKPDDPNCVAELNVGLMCSCIPVIFVLFKWPAEKLKATWNSVRSYVSSHTKSSRPITSEDNLVTVEDPGLPGVPKGKLGLGSSSSTYYELQSTDYDYHAFVRGGFRKGGQSKTS